MKVFVAAGAYKPKNELYLEDAKRLGRLLAENGFTYVQGGCDKGIMGATYSAFLNLSDNVELIVPNAYREDVENMPCKKLHLVDTINQRLLLIENMCSYIITIPGGFGTIDEVTNFVETYRSKEHSSTLILVNINGFYDNYIKQIKKMEEEGLVIEGIFEEVIKIVHSSEEAIEFILSDIKNKKACK
ncbi:MAG: hypothetical protein E7359_00250 [Clostridiales bacterium]|nr:hypothetical protein [Clostridiales bacterium]